MALGLGCSDGVTSSLLGVPWADCMRGSRDPSVGPGLIFV